MAEYYLMSQLPSLDGINNNMPVPITEERFLELCGRFLGKKAQSELKNLTLAPPINPEKSGSAVVQAWNENERNLRIALGKVRADKMKKSFDLKTDVLPVTLTRAASAAAEMDSPLEAEKFLDLYRMDFLESVRPMDNFSEEFVYYYGLKLKLLLRTRKFDTGVGEAAYRNIYNSIMSGDKLEAIYDQ